MPEMTVAKTNSNGEIEKSNFKENGFDKEKISLEIQNQEVKKWINKSKIDIKKIPKEINIKHLDEQIGKENKYTNAVYYLSGSIEDGSAKYKVSDLSGDQYHSIRGGEKLNQPESFTIKELYEKYGEELMVNETERIKKLNEENSFSND